MRILNIQSLVKLWSQISRKPVLPKDSTSDDKKTVQDLRRIGIHVGGKRWGLDK